MLFCMFSEYPDKSAVADLLGVSVKHLNFLLYGLARTGEQYIRFSIPKRQGGLRTIEAPVPALKRIQRALSDILYESAPIKSCAYAFCRDGKKGIKGNADRHKRRRWVVNIDLKDFFPSIHFGRVRGLFLSDPFNCTDEVATILAQVACCDGHLAMGAPCSPIISNLICRRLDNRLIDFAKENHLTYTRYADDLTFSTNLMELPRALGEIVDGRLVLSDTLRTIIEKENGFGINEGKVRFSTRSNRQDVTGLIVNEKVNIPRHFIREIRGMLYAWKKYGKLKAAKEHYRRYRPIELSNPEERFGREIVGRINYVGYIKGKEDNTYLTLCNKLWELEPKAKLKVRYKASSYDAVVFCEGISDPMHLKAALEFFRGKGEYTDLRVFFYPYYRDQHISNSELKDLMLHRARWKEVETMEFFLFDRDDPSYLDMEDKDGKPIHHGRGVYSLLLPPVSHRTSPRVCIEHYYENSDLLKKNKDGRRIFLSTEFDAANAYCAAEDVTTSNRKALRSDYEYILDDNVFDKYGKNVAMSKVAFATSVLKRNAPFDFMDFSHFRQIFDKLRTIIITSRPIPSASHL